MDIKHFALQECIEHDSFLLKRVTTVDNESDLLTKKLSRTLFYRHIECIMGKVVSDYGSISTS